MKFVNMSRIFCFVQKSLMILRNIENKFRNILLVIVEPKFLARGVVFMFLTSMLQGCLPSLFAAAFTTGVTASKNQTFVETVEDSKIFSAIKLALLKENFKELGVKINIDVSQGRVLYTGEIAQEEDGLKAVEIAWKQKGVKEVISELRVSKESTKFDFVQYTKDSMITAQIKTKSLLHKGIKFSNYTVLTVNNVVYLFGIARSSKELQLLADIAARVLGVEQVVSYVRVLESHDSEEGE